MSPPEPRPTQAERPAEQPPAEPSPQPTASFGTWYAAQWGRLVGALTVATGDKATAEDLAAEAFARAFDKWDGLNTKGEPTAWLYTVAFNDHKKRWRRLGREREALSLVSHGQAGTAAEPDAPQPELWSAVRALPARARMAVGLRYVADLTEREIAEVMGISRGTVASTLSGARRRLADELAASSAESRTTGREPSEQLNRRDAAGERRDTRPMPDDCEVT